MKTTIAFGLLVSALCIFPGAHQSDIDTPRALESAAIQAAPVLQTPSGPAFGLFCVPSPKLAEAYANGIRMVRPPYGYEGEWDYRLPGKPVALARYADSAAQAGMLELLFEPDRRLTQGVGKRTTTRDSSWLQTVGICRVELDTLFARMQRLFGKRIRLRAYIDEPSMKASQESRAVIAYASSSARAHGISFDIATMETGQPDVWYYPYADELLITRYEQGAHKDNNPRTTADRWMNWTEKWNDCNAIRTASGKPVSPIVAAHNWDSSCYGGFNDWGYPTQAAIETYIQDITTTFTPDRCWIYCGNDGTQNLWILPGGFSQIQRVFSVTAHWARP
jgi:hypothetical protein